MIEIKGVSKKLNMKGQELRLLADLSLTVKPGEFVTIFGPNGSGKSTLLNLISGLDEASGGEIRIKGKTPQEASIGFVFQNYQESLFPWRTVLENVIFPLEVKGIPKIKAIKLAERFLRKAQLLKYKDRYPYELSGGQKQLTSICRALVIEPDVLLLDEPCSALDYATTKRVELDILDLWEERQCTTVCVSHDVDEAVFLADRVVVLSPRPGKIKKIIPINLPRPRTPDLFQSLEFFQYRNRVLEAFAYE